MPTATEADVGGTALSIQDRTLRCGPECADMTALGGGVAVVPVRGLISGVGAGAMADALAPDCGRLDRVSRMSAQVPATGLEPVLKRGLKPVPLPLDYAGVI